MARIEWVKHRLDNWARWKASEQSGGLGFSKMAAFLFDVSPGYREAVIPVDNVDASLTDQAVQSLLGSRPHLHRTLVLIYLEDAGIRGASLKLGRAESTVKAQLEQADHALAQWFSDRMERQKAAKAAAMGTFTP